MGTVGVAHASSVGPWLEQFGEGLPWRGCNPAGCAYVREGQATKRISADALSARDATTGPVTPRSERLFSAGQRVRLGNGTFKVVAQTLTFRIEGSARYYILYYMVKAR